MAVDVTNLPPAAPVTGRLDPGQHGPMATTIAVLRGGALDGHVHPVAAGVAGLPPATISIDIPVIDERCDLLAGWARVSYFRVPSVRIGLPQSWEYRVLSARAV